MTHKLFVVNIQNYLKYRFWILLLMVENFELIRRKVILQNRPYFPRQNKRTQTYKT